MADKPMMFGNGEKMFVCKSALDFIILLSFIREKVEPNKPITGLWYEIMSSALRKFGSKNKQTLLKGKEIEMIYVDVVDEVRHLVVVIEGIHHSFSIYTLAGIRPEKTEILERKRELRELGQMPYDIITIES